MNSINNVPITIVRGDTLEFTAGFEDLAGDLSAASLTAKESPESVAVLNKTLGDGITKIGAGLYDVKADPADTAAMAPGRYMYNFKVTTGDGEVYTIMLGVLEVLPTT